MKNVSDTNRDIVSEIISKVITDNAGIGKVNIVLHKLYVETVKEGISVTLDFTVKAKKSIILLKLGTSDLGLFIIRKVLKLWLGVNIKLRNPKDNIINEEKEQITATVSDSNEILDENKSVNLVKSIKIEYMIFGVLGRRRTFLFLKMK